MLVLKKKTADLIAEDAPRTVSHLKLDGREIAALGFVGKEIGDCQSKALFAVARGDIKNEKEEIKAFLKNIKDF